MSNKIWWYISAVVAMIIGIGLVAFVELNAPPPVAPNKLTISPSGLDTQSNSTMLQWIGLSIFVCGLFVLLWVSTALAAIVGFVQGIRRPTIGQPIAQQPTIPDSLNPPASDTSQGSALPPE